jgi:hypothetical protein
MVSSICFRIHYLCHYALGTIYSSYLFKDDDRQPDGEFMILNYIGGARDTVVADMTDEVGLCAI